MEIKKGEREITNGNGREKREGKRERIEIKKNKERVRKRRIEIKNDKEIGRKKRK